MTEKAAKKVKEPKQTPEARLEAMRYNHMMYGPTAGERMQVAKKVDYGAAYLKHPKFQSLMTAFKKGTASKFEVTAGEKVYSIATEDSQILFNNKVIFYSRPLNRHEENLLLDRAATVQYQGTDALVHLVFAVIRAFPELGLPELAYQHKQFYVGIETLDARAEELGSSLLIGGFKHAKVMERPKR